MKKFISFVMAAAMVASLVPATAFAKGDVSATAKVVDALNMTKDEAAGKVINETNKTEKVPELQLTITNTNYRNTEEGTLPELNVTVTLDNAEFAGKNGTTAPTNGTVADPGDWEDFVDFDFANRDGGSIWDTNLTGVLKKAGKPDIKVSSLRDLAGWDAIKAFMDVNKNANANSGQIALTYADLPGGSQVAAHEVAITDGTTTKKIAVVNATPDGFDGTATVDLDVTDADDAAELVGYLASGDWDFVTVGDDACLSVQDDADSKVKFDTVTASVPDFTVAEQVAELTGAPFSYDEGNYVNVGSASDVYLKGVKDVSEDQVTFIFAGHFAKDDVIIIDLFSKLDKAGVGKNATVSVSGPVEADDLVYASVKGRGITATTRKVGSIAEEEIINLASDIKISSTVGDFVDDQWFEMKLSKGFEFSDFTRTNSPAIKAASIDFDGNTAYFQFDAGNPDNDAFTIDKDDIEIESTSAKSGATCTITVKALDKDWNKLAQELQTSANPNADKLFNATATVEVMKVVDYKVELTVDEDEDVPVIYSGVNADNYGITDDSDHWSLEVTAKETFPGAWSMRKGFNFELPEHVYVADIDGVDVTSTDNFFRNYDRTDESGAVDEDDVEAAFWNAYRDGSHVNFEFEKRVFDDVDNDLRDRKCAEMTFKLKLVADPGFEGDVVLKLTGDLVDDQEVTIAKFVKPYEVKAEQNDLKIDYRYTDIPTDITITEAEKGLWAKNEAEFFFYIEKAITFDSDPTFEIDSKSGLEIKDDKVNGGTIQFTVKSESDEAATVTIKDMDLFMERNIPAGPYDLKIASSLEEAYLDQVLFAPDHLTKATVGDSSGIDGFSDTAIKNAIPGPGKNNHHNYDGADCDNHKTIKADSYVGCVADYSKVVKEAFINVITAGREVDDASFTTKVVVPVGENYIVAGEKQIELDTPAYINEAGYTMLPIRAVATALGINNNNVLWDQPTKTVTILYGQRIITMTQGQKVVYVNGSAIPASAAVENTNSRTFLPMRDLATALGVTDITWDQATRTATLNGNQTTSAK